MAVPSPRVPASGLPVEEIIGDLRHALARSGAAVLQAEPGAGKTTIVPLRLLDEVWAASGRIVVLEPRRVAARAAAHRMAALLGEEVGRTVGYSTRDERRVSGATQIEVVTDGIWTRRIQRDPSLEDTAIVIFDEFHERHLEADLGLALTLDAREGLRRDLRLLVMSATIDAAAVAGLIGDASVISSAGRSFPVEIRWLPRRPDDHLQSVVASAVRRAIDHDDGDILVFLPGAGEIGAVHRALGTLPGVDVVPLHGSLSPAAQDRALRLGERRRVVLATDLAESSVTVEGVAVTVDAGLVRRPAYDVASGLSRLRTTPSSRASADQRAGRAGRSAPGVAYRLWSEAEHLARRQWPDPEILSADLAPLALELVAWGASSDALRWLDAPPAAALTIASSLLVELGAVADARVTDLGRAVLDLPLHPRLARMLLAATPAARRRAAVLAAMLSERDIVRRGGRDAPASADITERLALLDGGGSGSFEVDRDAMATVRRRAEELLRRAGGVSARIRHTDDDSGALLASAYPDRIAQSRGGARYRLRHGSGATLPDHDPLIGTQWLVLADIDGAGAIGSADGRIRLAAAIDRSDVEAIGNGSITTVVDVEWDPAVNDLRATTERRLDALVLDRARSTPLPGAEASAALIAHVVASALTPLGWSGAARSLQARARWAYSSLGAAWPDLSDDALVATVDAWLVPLLATAVGARDLANVDMAATLRSMLGGRVAELDRVVPRSVTLAGGRTVAVEYDGERPTISVRAQDLYGTTVHPTIANGRVPITVVLLSPAGRPIQITADVPGFWAGSWKVVRREMATRYPKHAWPEDPSTATHR